MAGPRLGAGEDLAWGNSLDFMFSVYKGSKGPGVTATCISYLRKTEAHSTPHSLT